MLNLAEDVFCDFADRLAVASNRFSREPDIAQQDSVWGQMLKDAVDKGVPTGTPLAQRMMRSLTAEDCAWADPHR